ncbi:MAG: hypothetical protein GXP16_08560 [Gammaproteobacteria bacterium]|nr:hypothetical protein [Gammaproteobacteria bacterium]
MVKKQMLKIVGLALSVFMGCSASADEVRKASEWMGRIVVTPQGELLGRIEDFALNKNATAVDFVVISIGSFLVDENLIAVDPNALGQSEDGRYLVIHVEDLSEARRFGDNNWPAQADVVASGSQDAVHIDDNIEISDATNTVASGVATISSPSRTGSIASGQRESQIESTARVVKNAADEVQNGTLQPKKYDQKVGAGLELEITQAFRNLDSDGNGYLSRREIGTQLKPNDLFTDYDLDANEGIDPFEYQVWQSKSG